MELNQVLLDFDDSVALMKFNHPEVMNAIGADMLEGLDDALAAIQDPGNGARCLVITGEGRGLLLRRQSGGHRRIERASRRRERLA